MSNRINIAECLIDCPKGMALDCTMYDNLYFDSLNADYYGTINCYTLIDGIKTSINFTKYGTFNNHPGAKCVIFPKDKTTWEGFQRPFKDGDVVFYDDNIAIFKEWGDETLFKTYVTKYLCCDSLIDTNIPLFGKYIHKHTRFATEEEKEKLFQTIKDNGYKWNPETKTLDPWFKDGDVCTTIMGTIFIYKKTTTYNYCGSYVSFFKGALYPHYDSYPEDCCRLATEEEKEKLFQAIKYNGYVWDSNTKTLEEVRIKPGDVVVSAAGNIVLVSNIDENDGVHFLCRLNPFNTFEIKEDVGVGTADNCTLASDKQKQRLFDCLAHEGYKYNPKENKLEKISTIKLCTGDVVKDKQNGIYCTIEGYAEELKGYNTSIGLFIPNNKVDEWEIVPDRDTTNKFDVHTLNEFDKVLTRNTNGHAWNADFFSHVIDTNPKLPITFVCIGGRCPNQCIPFKGNEHLRGKTDDCNDYFKTWE